VLLVAQFSQLVWVMGDMTHRRKQFYKQIIMYDKKINLLAVFPLLFKVGEGLGNPPRPLPLGESSPRPLPTPDVSDKEFGANFTSFGLVNCPPLFAVRVPLNFAEADFTEFTDALPKSKPSLSSSSDSAPAGIAAKLFREPVLFLKAPFSLLS